MKVWINAHKWSINWRVENWNQSSLLPESCRLTWCTKRLLLSLKSTIVNKQWNKKCCFNIGHLFAHLLFNLSQALRNRDRILFPEGPFQICHTQVSCESVWLKFLLCPTPAHWIDTWVKSLQGRDRWTVDWDPQQTLNTPRQEKAAKHLLKAPHPPIVLLSWRHLYTAPRDVHLTIPRLIVALFLSSTWSVQKSDMWAENRLIRWRTVDCIQIYVAILWWQEWSIWKA